MRKTANYQIGPDGMYRIDDYDEMPAFSSFLPGIGGPDGVPLWCMYVNRGQAVVSFGTANKDNAIAEFLPATWAYQLVGIQGFRTFCKVDGQYYEPFQKNLTSIDYDYSRSMHIQTDRLELTEVNKTLGLRFDVEYFSPVNKPVGSLIRLVTISNESSQAKKLDILDGLALIIPTGFTDFGLKAMRRISEAYASVHLTCDQIPFFAAKVMAHDEAEVVKIEEGNFYASWVCCNGKLEYVEPFVDPDIIFGANNDLVTPRLFISQNTLDRDAQIWENRFPCALTPLNTTLKPGESIKVVALSGFSPNEQMLTDFLPDYKSLQDFETASLQSRELINSLLLPAFTLSEIPLFDAYAKQNYLDNVLRGGIPKIFPSKSGSIPLHIYSRRHGDLERDYNYFELSRHPLSSGPGNYRDICQNRRNDIWFYPDLWDQEIRMFAGLIQADGYNPLGIKGYYWVLPRGIDPLQFCPATDEKAKTEFEMIFRKEFHPGQLLNWSLINSVEIVDRSKWLNEILENCDHKLLASGHEGGYWVDHWDYIVDLLDAFAAIYPDKIREVLTDKADIGWFYEGANVVKRSDKYIFFSSGPLQIDTVIDNPLSLKELPAVTVLGKLCALLAIKAVSFDYECKGIEMEAGRPGWNDSMNGLPGLFGSSSCETAEIATLAMWLLKNLPEIPDTNFPVEVADLIDEVVENLTEDLYNWDRCATIRENYRERIYSKISGKTRKINSDQLKTLLGKVKTRAERAIADSIDQRTGLVNTYFMGKPVNAQPQKEKDGSDRLHSKREMPCAQINEFKQEPLPLFLEGQVRWLRMLNDPKMAREIYTAVRKSPIFDTELNMYKLNECLDSCPPEIGRARTFTRGWFENESIWLHMSYKYLFELLRAGLTEEFFEDAKTMLVPFMDPRVYGRSILENSSFLASSANPDKNTRGRGFVARLSGSTAEFIHIWLLLTVGQHPFSMEQGQLHFALKPVLPGEWFTKEQKNVEWNDQSINIPKNSFVCTLLGTVLLVYHNESRQNTFGSSGAKPVRYVLDEETQIDAEYIAPDIAERIRQRGYGRLDVWLE